MTFMLPNGVRVSEFQPSRDCEIFVYKIPRSVREQELTSMFEKYGDIYHLRLVQRAEKDIIMLLFVLRIKLLLK